MNERFVHGLDELGLATSRLGYEQLATAPRTVLLRTCAAVGLDFQESMLTLRPDANHIMVGNNMRLSADKTESLMYSIRWLSRTEWLLPSLLMRSTMKRNTAWVYAGGEPLPVDRYPPTSRPGVRPDG
jgi:hypothetical protein